VKASVSGILNTQYARFFIPTSKLMIRIYCVCNNYMYNTIITNKVYVFIGPDRCSAAAAVAAAGMRGFAPA
jgi:hypothetical protein